MCKISMGHFNKVMGHKTYAGIIQFMAILGQFFRVFILPKIIYILMLLNTLPLRSVSGALYVLLHLALTANNICQHHQPKPLIAATSFTTITHCPPMISHKCKHFMRNIVLNQSEHQFAFQIILLHCFQTGCFQTGTHLAICGEELGDRLNITMRSYQAFHCVIFMMEILVCSFAEDLSSVNSPHNGQWRGALMFSLICAWIIGWVNNREAGDLRRHRAHYVVIQIYGHNLPKILPLGKAQKVISLLCDVFNTLLQHTYFNTLRPR